MKTSALRRWLVSLGLIAHEQTTRFTGGHDWYLKSTIYCAVIVFFFKNESFVSLTRIAANMNTNPITEKTVNDSIPIRTGIKIPNIDSNPKIIAAVDGFVYFCPMF